MKNDYLIKKILCNIISLKSDVNMPLMMKNMKVAVDAKIMILFRNNSRECLIEKGEAFSYSIIYNHYFLFRSNNPKALENIL